MSEINDRLLNCVMLPMDNIDQVRRLLDDQDAKSKKINNQYWIKQVEDMADSCESHTCKLSQADCVLAGYGCRRWNQIKGDAEK